MNGCFLQRSTLTWIAGYILVNKKTLFSTRSITFFKWYLRLLQLLRKILSNVHRLQASFVNLKFCLQIFRNDQNVILTRCQQEREPFFFSDKISQYISDNEIRTRSKWRQSWAWDTFICKELKFGLASNHGLVVKAYDRGVVGSNPSTEYCINVIDIAQNYKQYRIIKIK